MDIKSVLTEAIIKTAKEAIAAGVVLFGLVFGVEAYGMPVKYVGLAIIPLFVVMVNTLFVFMASKMIGRSSCPDGISSSRIRSLICLLFISILLTEMVSKSQPRKLPCLISLESSM